LLDRQSVPPRVPAAPGDRVGGAAREGQARPLFSWRSTRASPNQTSAEGSAAGTLLGTDPRVGGRPSRPYRALAGDGLRPRPGGSAGTDLAQGGQRPSPRPARPGRRLVVGPAPGRAPQRPQPAPAAPAEAAAGPRLGRRPPRPHRLVADGEI